uniref:Uncharacterized protein n=1 Tax=Ciona savignyi TaxID=51511 RepID=H2YPC4_CIOSA
MDMCGIEDLMANTVLVQAKSDNPSNNKYRKNFVLPPVSTCDEALKLVDIEMHNLTPDTTRSDPQLKAAFEFNQLCERQPIGKEMFKKFCQAPFRPRQTTSLRQRCVRYSIGERGEGGGTDEGRC